MSSISYSEPGSDKVGRTNGSGTRVATERASSQATRPRLKVSVKRLESIGRNLLLAIGEDPTREGLRMTPNRFAHLCMQMRGVKSDGLMSTSVMRGLFRSTDAREEFLTLAFGKRNGK
jgi:GTP cyclohydrolase I